MRREGRPFQKADGFPNPECAIARFKTTAERRTEIEPYAHAWPGLVMHVASTREPFEREGSACTVFRRQHNDELKCLGWTGGPENVWFYLFDCVHVAGSAGKA
jgi:hypothetical protein